MAVSHASGELPHPYGGAPGSSTPSPQVDRKEGTFELWAFFGLALLNTAIIAISGLVAWMLVHHLI